MSEMDQGNTVGSLTAGKEKPLGKREIIALLDATKSPGGWGLFNRKSTEKLAARGYFERAEHRAYGMQWRITDAGRAALSAAKGET